MSSHFFCLWASSSSSRVGAARSCIQRLDAPSRRVLIKLMMTWRAVSVFFTKEQLPSKTVTTPLLDLYLACNMIVKTRFTSKTVAEVTIAVLSRIPRLECQVLQVFARTCFGSTSGNHGESRSIFPKRTSRSSGSFAEEEMDLECERLEWFSSSAIGSRSYAVDLDDGFRRDSDGCRVQLRSISMQFCILHSGPGAHA